MDLEILSDLDDAELWRRLDIACPKDSPLRKWTWNVTRVVSELSSRWVLARLTGSALGEIVLPWHVSQTDGNYDVVPPEGQRLTKVAADLDSRIRENAPSFFNRIEAMSDAPLGYLFITQVVPHDEPTYSQLELGPSEFTTLDGLHRLVAASRRGLPSDPVEVAAALN